MEINIFRLSVDTFHRQVQSALVYAVVAETGVANYLEYIGGVVGRIAVGDAERRRLEWRKSLRYVARKRERMERVRLEYGNRTSGQDNGEGVTTYSHVVFINNNNYHCN